MTDYVTRAELVEPTNPQSLREKWIKRLPSRMGQVMSAKLAWSMFNDIAPEGGPPSAWELKPGQCLAMDDNGDIVLSNLSAFDSGTILKRWPARKP